MARSTSTTLPSSDADPGLNEAATRIIHKLLSHFDGSLALRLWNDATHSFGQRAGQIAAERGFRNRPSHGHFAQRRRILQVGQDRIVHGGASNRH